MGISKYTIGDALTHKEDEKGKIMILNLCNDRGNWDTEFHIVMSKKWVYPEDIYRSIPATQYRLGGVTFVNVEKDVIVANAIVLHGIRTNSKGIHPFQYDAFEKALKGINKVCLEEKCVSLHMSLIDDDIADDWKRIESTINKIITIPVIIYDYPIVSRIMTVV